MNQQQIADRLHAAFLKATTSYGGKPWLAVAAEMEAINNPVVEPSPVAKIQTERNMALDAGVEYQQLLEKHKAIEESNKSLVDKLAKANRDLFAYGEFAASLAKAVGWNDMMEISFDGVVIAAKDLKVSHDHYFYRTNKLGEIYREQIEKLQQAATYIEGLERDLLSASNIIDHQLGWQLAVKNAVAL